MRRIKIGSILAGGAILVAIVVPGVGFAQTLQTKQAMPALEGIDLTSRQQEQLARIREDSLSEISTILTPEQRVKFAKAAADREPKEALQDLDLS